MHTETTPKDPLLAPFRLRHLTISRQAAVVEQSLMMKAKEEKDRSGRSYEERKPYDADKGADKGADKAAAADSKESPAEETAAEEVESAPAEATEAEEEAAPVELAEEDTSKKAADADSAEA